MDLTLQDVLLGKLDAEVILLNFFIALVKLHIWISRNHGVTPSLSAFKNLVKGKFRTEKYIATKIIQNVIFRLDGNLTLIIY